MSLESLERREKALFLKFHHLPNNPERERIYKQWKKVYDAITASL